MVKHCAVLAKDDRSFFVVDERGEEMVLKKKKGRFWNRREKR